LALNEAAHRDHNERVEERVHLFRGTPKFGIVCECDDDACASRLIVTVAEYEHVRSDPVLFFVVPGHEDPRVEQVVRTSDRFLVVRKTGEAAEVAKDESARGRE
jgi:hypothetical protein